MTLTKAERERAFHNETFATHSRQRVWRFYEAARGSRERYTELLAQQPPGSTVLEIGCGPTSLAAPLSRMGCSVTAIDVSDEAVAQSRARYPDVRYMRMDAEELELPDRSFDLVCGAGIVHHLETATALTEVARVLRPEGRGVFVDPLGHNPALNAYRRRTPEMRTPDEHPLRRDDFAIARDLFTDVRVEFFELAAVAATPLRGSRSFEPALRALRGLDRVLLHQRSPMRWLAWMAVFQLSGPAQRR